MAGLLDFLGTDDAQLGLGLLAAGGPSATPMDFGQRIAAGVQHAQASKDSRLRNKLLESQIAENTSQDAVRRAQLERQQRQDAYYMGGALPGAGAGLMAGAGAAPAAGATPASAGSALKAAAGAPPDAPPPAQGKFAEWSKQFNIPVDALVADYFSNGGKGIADMLFKAGRPDMQVSNGYAYDKNRQGAGYLPQLNISSNGQATQVQIGPNGQPVVSAPQGAVGTYGAYQAAGNRSAADYQPETVIDPATGQKVVRPRSEVLQPTALPGAPLGAALGERNNNPGNLRPVGASTGFQQFATPEAGLAALDQNLQAYGKRGINTVEGVIGRWAPSSENNTSAYVSSVAKRLGIDPKAQIDLGNPYVRQALGTAIMLHENGPSILTRGAGASAGSAPLIGPGAGAPRPAAGNVVELSPQQQAANEASRRFQTGVAEGAATTVGESRASAQSAAQTLANVQQIRSGIDKAILGPGANVRVSAAQIGQMLGVTGKDNAEQLANTRNVIQGLARQELAAAGQMKGQGQITENERAILRRAEAGDIGNFTRPELVTLLGSLEKTANYRLQSHNSLLERVQAGETPIELMSVRAPAAPGTPAATPAPGGLPPGWTVKVR